LPDLLNTTSTLQHLAHKQNVLHHCADAAAAAESSGKKLLNWGEDGKYNCKI
jgi:hypothetical protein